jgi:hypothetical protein
MPIQISGGTPDSGSPQNFRAVALEWVKILIPVSAGLLLYYGASLVNPLEQRLEEVEKDISRDHTEFKAEVRILREYTVLDQERREALRDRMDELEEEVKALSKTLTRHEVHHAGSHPPQP